MFRLQNNVPEVYPDKSRDFQLFCRLYDVAFNSVKQSIDSLQNVTNTGLCDSSLLELLKDKLGFYTSVDASEEELRYILQAFPTIMRYKGSKKAIDYITNLYSRLISSISTAKHVDISIVGSSYMIEVSSEAPVVKTDLLFELLKYVLPTGYIIDYFVTHVEESTSTFGLNGELYYNVTRAPLVDKYFGSPPVKTRIVVAKDIAELDELVSAKSKGLVSAEDEDKTIRWSNELPNIINIASIADNDKDKD